MADKIEFPFVGGPLDQQYVSVDANATEWHVSTDAWTASGHTLKMRYLRYVYAFSRHERRHFFAPDRMPQEEAVFRFLEFNKGVLA